MLPIVYSTNNRNKHDMGVIVNQSAQQKRVSEMAFLVNKYAISGREDFINKFNEEENAFEETLKGISDATQEIRDLWKSYRDLSRVMIVDIKKIWTGEDVSLEEIAASKNKLQEVGAQLDAAINSMVLKMEKESIRRADNIFYTTSILIILAIFLGTFFMYFFSRVMLQPFSKIISELDLVSRG